MESPISASWLRENAKFFDTQNWQPCFIAHENLRRELDAYGYRNPFPQRIEHLEPAYQCPMSTISERPFCAHYHQIFLREEDAISVRMKFLQKTGIVEATEVEALKKQRRILLDLDDEARIVRVTLSLLLLEERGHDVSARPEVNKITNKPKVKAELLAYLSTAFRDKYLAVFTAIKEQLSSVHTRMLAAAERMEQTMPQPSPNTTLELTTA